MTPIEAATIAVVVQFLTAGVGGLYLACAGKADSFIRHFGVSSTIIVMFFLAAGVLLAPRPIQKTLETNGVIGLEPLVLDHGYVYYPGTSTDRFMRKAINDMQEDLRELKDKGN